MPEPQANTTQDKDSVRAAILAAASREFAATGLRGASVRTIATRAGVTAAMINYYFGGKRALYDVVVEHAESRLFALITLHLSDPDRDELPARLAAAYFDFLCEERDLPRLLLREMLDDGDSVGSVVHKYVKPLAGLLRREFGAADETLQTAVSVFGMVASYFMYAPVLTPFVGADPLSEGPLARRRRHVVEMARLMARAHEA